MHTSSCRCEAVLFERHRIRQQLQVCIENNRELTVQLNDAQAETKAVRAFFSWQSLKNWVAQVRLSFSLFLSSSLPLPPLLCLPSSSLFALPVSTDTTCMRRRS